MVFWLIGVGNKKQKLSNKEKDMERKGIDVSSWQGKPDWEKVKTAGISFALLRITEKNGADTSFEHNYKGCKENGIPAGVYKYSYALTVADIQREAQGVLDTLAGRGLDFPVFLDLEDENQRKLSESTLNTMIKTFWSVVTAAGYRFGIYCNVDWYNNVIPAEAKSKYEFWLAAYPANDNGTIQERLRPSVGVGWQYSSKGKISGISGNVDLDVFYKDYTGGNEMSKVEKATQQMETWANDSAHGYDQTYRWGEKGDYDCSSAVIQAYENAGVPVKTKGATYTGNMRSVFLQCGFKDVTSKCNLSTGVGLKRGDVLLNTVHHTAMYCGNGKEVEASINEKGTATGGKPGDQTGKEFLIRSYRNYPWNYVLRYEESELVIDATHWLEKGDTGILVKEIQEDLIYLGFSCGPDGADGEYGDNTVKAVKEVQKAYGLTQDGQYGLKTKNAVDKAVTQKKKEEEVNKLQTAVLDKVTFPYIKKGSKGIGVNMLQTMLGTKVTGTFNDDDVKAFKAFQKNTKQSQDGICGENGWKAVAAHILANTK